MKISTFTKLLWCQLHIHVLGALVNTRIILCDTIKPPHNNKWQWQYRLNGKLKSDTLLVSYKVSFFNIWGEKYTNVNWIRFNYWQKSWQCDYCLVLIDLHEIPYCTTYGFIWLNASFTPVFYNQRGSRWWTTWNPKPKISINIQWWKYSFIIHVIKLAQFTNCNTWVWNTI